MVIILIRGKDTISPPEDEMPALALPFSKHKRSLTVERI